MEPLPDEVQVNGTGIPELTARLVRRHKKLCLDERSDDVFEVLIVKVQKEREIFGKTYPTKEVYPGNEDFGVTAWCYKDRKEAEKKFNRLIGWNKV